MYVKLKKNVNVVSLPDSYVELVSYENDNLTLDLTYNYDQEIGIKNNVTKVTVEIAKALRPKTAPSQTRSIVNPILKIQSIRQEHLSAIVKHNYQDVLSKKVSDPTKKLDNTVVHKLTQGYTALQLPQLSRLVKKTSVTSNSDAVQGVKNLLVQHDVGESTTDARKLGEQLITKGVDPSESYSVNQLGITTKEALEGTNKASLSNLSTPQQSLMYKYKNSTTLRPITQDSPGSAGQTIVKQDELVTVTTFERVVASQANVTERVAFDYKWSDEDKLYLTIRAVDRNGVTTQLVERTIAPKSYIKLHATPVKAPIAKTTGYARKSHALLSVKQTDQQAKKVLVYKRVYDHHTANHGDYSLVAEFDLTTSDGYKYIPVQNSIGNTTIYRVVAVGEYDAVGTDFATVVVKPSERSSKVKRVTGVVTPTANGVDLEVSNIPADCVSFSLLREDVTTHKGKLLQVQSQTVVDDSASYVVQDTTLKKSHSYRYYCDLYDRSGSKQRRSVASYKHTPLEDAFVNTRIVDAKTSILGNQYDVTFLLNTEVVSSNVDRYKQMLENQGQFDFFQNELTDTRDKLRSLVAHAVTRIDLTTGEVEDFGTITDEEFSDLKHGKIAGVSMPKIGRRYRYVVNALLRNTETLLEDFVKTKKDAVTSREYQFKPSKFLHPLALTEGNLTSPASLRVHHTSDPMYFGAVGNYTTADVSLEKDVPVIANVTLERFGKKAKLSWTLYDVTDQIDHFQVLQSIDGVPTVIGKCFCVTDVRTYQHVLYTADAGVARYSVKPVYKDFALGELVDASNDDGALT